MTDDVQRILRDVRAMGREIKRLRAALAHEKKKRVNLIHAANDILFDATGEPESFGALGIPAEKVRRLRRLAR